MAEANRIQVSFSRETVYGTPLTAAYNEIPIIGGAMVHSNAFNRSATIRADAQRDASERTSEEPNASYDFEFEATTFDEFMRGALRSDADWTTDVAISGTDIAAVASGNKFTKASNWTGENIVVGQWVYVGGFTGNTTNNGWVQVTALSTTDLTVAGKTLVDDTAGETVTVDGNHLLNGTAKHSYTIQQEYKDLTNHWHLLDGARISSLSQTITPDAIIQGNVSFDGQTRTQTTSDNGTFTAAASKDVMPEGTAFGGHLIDLAATTYDIMGLSWTINIPTRPRKPLGATVRSDIELGSPEVTGSMEVYLEDGTWALDTNWTAFTKMSMAYSLVEGTDRYLFYFPQIVMTSEPAVIGGVDTDIMLSFDWEAEAAELYSGGAVHTMQVSRV